MTERTTAADKRRFWTDAELQKLAALYPYRLTKEIAEQFGRTERLVYVAAHSLGIKKDPGFLRDHCRLQKGSRIGVEHRFPEGNVPMNKGIRRPGWHAGRMLETQFKKGNRSGAAARNWRPVGTILPDSEGYLRIKVREAVYGQEPTGFRNVRVWPLLARVLWVEHYGPIPAKHLVTYKDGDRGNCVIGNLELRSMADNARRNSMWTNYPRELAEAIQLSGALKRKLRRIYGEK